MTEFTLTADHLKLLRELRVTAGEQSPQVDGKRPLGNGDVVADVCRVLGWTPPNWDEPPPRAGQTFRAAAEKMLELTPALQIVLQHLPAGPRLGRYTRADYRTWAWADHLPAGQPREGSAE